MNIILYFFMAINTILITAFILGRCFVFKQKQNPNLRAGYSVFLGVLFLIYFISILLFVGISILHHKYLEITLLAFIAIPFFIGEKASYEKLRLYSNLQLLMFFASLLLSYFLK